MTTSKNHVIYNDNQDELKRLRDEYVYIGRECRLTDGVLTVLALPAGRKSKKVK